MSTNHWSTPTLVGRFIVSRITGTTPVAFSVEQLVHEELNKILQEKGENITLPFPKRVSSINSPQHGNNTKVTGDVCIHTKAVNLRISTVSDVAVGLESIITEHLVS